MTSLKHKAGVPALSCSVFAIALSLNPFAGGASAQTPGGDLPELVVTADRTPEPISSTGSAISVVNRTTLDTTNPGSIVDSLRSVPGLDITETGGPGGIANVRLRGGNTGQTLVLIDGVRANDPSGAAGEFDFAMFTPSAIERIEVLRGPQSALYGSDAIGGVINIITKKGSGPTRFDLRTEAGSYGTVSTNASMLGSTGPWSYAVTGSGQRSDGFSRYGYRIPAIEARFPNLESDGYQRLSGSARIGYDAGDGVRVDIGALSSFIRADYDAATGTFPDTPAKSDRLFQQINARVAVDTFGGVLTHSLNTFVNHTDRSFNDVNYKINMLPINTTSTISDFIGDREGAEYQANLRMGKFGSLVYGAKAEHETANTYNTNLLPIAGPRTPTLAAQQDTRSLFALWQLPLGDRLTVTAGGRVDDVVKVASFETWRTTAAFAIPETGTKLRGSAGTGAKAPTLFQLYAPTFGNAALRPEQSFGYDAGVDQNLFNGRVTLSLTGFENRFSDLIEFDTTTSRYFNVSKARTYGVELGSEVQIAPGYMKLTAAYTYLQARDERTNLTLARRPEHLARLALAITPTAAWLIEPRVVLVSRRFSGANQTSPLDPYARIDLYSDYRFNPNWKVFARGENIFNARYQEVLNYGTTGPAIYGGFNATW